MKYIWLLIFHLVSVVFADAQELSVYVVSDNANKLVPGETLALKFFFVLPPNEKPFQNTKMQGIIFRDTQTMTDSILINIKDLNPTSVDLNSNSVEFLTSVLIDKNFKPGTYIIGGLLGDNGNYFLLDKILYDNKARVNIVGRVAQKPSSQTIPGQALIPSQLDRNFNAGNFPAFTSDIFTEINLSKSSMHTAFSTAFLQNLDSLQSPNIRIPAAFKTLYFGNFLDDSVIFHSLQKWISLPENEMMKNSVSFVNPIFLQGINPQDIEKCVQKYSPYANKRFHIMPYSVGGLFHWFVIVFDSKENLFFVLDSAKRSTALDYKNDIAKFAFILDYFLDVPGFTQSEIVIFKRRMPKSSLERPSLYPSREILDSDDIVKRIVLWNGAPQQSDGHSCGVYAIRNAAYIAKNLSLLAKIKSQPQFSITASPNFEVSMRKNTFTALSQMCYSGDPTMDYPECLGLVDLSNDILFY